MNGRAPRKAKNSRQVSAALPPVPTNATATVTVATVTVSIAFNVPVVCKGVPASFDVADVTVNSVTVVDSQHIQLHLSGSGAGKAWSLGANDPALRTSTGGYVNAAADTFP